MAMKKVTDYKLEGGYSYRFSFELATDDHYDLYFTVNKYSNKKPDVRYVAGCRKFRTKQAAINHWTRRKKAAEKKLSKLQPIYDRALAKVDQEEIRKLRKSYSHGRLIWFVSWRGEVEEGRVYHNFSEKRRQNLINRLKKLNKETLLYILNSGRYFSNRADIDEWKEVHNRATIFIKALKEFPEEKMLRKYRL